MGLYFIALIPTSGMTAAWTGLANGDLESALVAMAVNLLAAVAILPVYLSVLIPGSVGFDPTALYRQLAQVVVAAETLPTGAVLPIALAYVLQPPLGVLYMHYRRDVVEDGLSLREAAARLV